MALLSSDNFIVTEGVKADEVLTVQILGFTLFKKLTFLFYPEVRSRRVKLLPALDT